MSGEAQFVALDGLPGTSWLTYRGPGRAIMADVASYPYKPFDVAVAFLTLMDLPSSDAATFIVDIAEQDEAGRGNHHHK